MSFIDVHLFDSLDGGNVTDSLDTRDGLETSVYLSLFGGNALDDGRPQNPATWWGNIGESEAAKQYRSEAAFLLRTVPPNTANLKRIEAAAARDLAWMVPEYANAVRVNAVMPKLNAVKLEVFIDGLDPLNFRTDWGEKVKPPVSQLLPPKISRNNGVNLEGTAQANTSLVLIRANGSRVVTNVDASGNWAFDVYPLARAERGRMYVQDASGKMSGMVTIIGVIPLRYDGLIKFDGTHKYNGARLN